MGCGGTGALAGSMNRLLPNRCLLLPARCAARGTDDSTRSSSLLKRLFLVLALGFFANALVTAALAISVNVHAARSVGGASPRRRCTGRYLLQTPSDRSGSRRIPFDWLDFLSSVDSGSTAKATTPT